MMHYYQHNNLEYRPEIDVLRAIAVISVVLFHFNIPYFKGGFVGVDAFFVISGFLISRIIISKMEINNFNFVDFYLNRAKRLLPALYVLLIVCITIGLIIFDYSSLKDLGKQVIATNLYFSNFLFWRDAGYFDLPPILKPLLHTWSLSIEEQFYLFFPLFIYLSFKLGKKIFLLITILTLISSFVFNLYGIIHFKSATFYFLPTRAWEFQIGTIIFLIQKNKNLKLNNWFLLFFFLGLVFLFLSIFNFSSVTAYPGWPSLFPVLGTALIIYTGRIIPLKILSNNFLIFFGKISYSLYLWHWPIYAFSKYILMRDPHLWESLILFLLSVLIAWISCKFIENPFRYKLNTTKWKKHFCFGILAVSFFISLIGYLCYKSEGFPKRSKLNSLLIDVYSDSLWNEYLQSGIEYSKGYRSKPLQIGSRVDSVKFLLWGDSHARALALGLNDYFEKNGNGCYLASLSSTPPLLNVRNSKNADFEFESFNNKVFEFVKNHLEVKRIILCSRWSYYINDNFSELELRSQPYFVKTNSKENITSNSKATNFVYGLKSTVDSLIKLGKIVYLVNPIPELKQDVRNLLGNYFFMSIQNKHINDYGIEEKEYEFTNKYIIKLFDSLSINTQVRILKFEKPLFKNKVSIIMENDKLYYKDDNHLSKHGSRYVVNNYVDLFSDIK